MGFYALAGYERDKRQKNMVKNYMINDVTKRRDYIKTLLMASSDKAAEQLPHIMPDYMLVFAVPVLAHNPRFTMHSNVDQLVRSRIGLDFTGTLFLCKIIVF